MTQLHVYILQCQLLETNQQMGDQSEYCSSMGAAVCTLLWRVSRQQESITSLLGGVCLLVSLSVKFRVFILQSLNNSVFGK